VKFLINCGLKFAALITSETFSTGTVQRFFPGKTDSEIKGYVRQKLQNEAKRLRKRPHPAEDPLVGSFKEAGAMFEY